MAVTSKDDAGPRKHFISRGSMIVKLLREPRANAASRLRVTTVRVHGGGFAMAPMITVGN